MVRVLALIAMAQVLGGAPLVFRNASGQVRYLGSKACAGCHREIFEKYGKTGMGRSVTRPRAEMAATPVRVRSEKFDREYRVEAEGGALYQAEKQVRGGEVVFEARHKLEYAIGSGENGISFAVRRGDHLFQAPLSYYAAAKRWDLSPGFEATGEGFNRPIQEECITCHAGRVQAVAGRDGQYGEPPLAEMAVGCENCHGPGALHVAERSKGKVAVPDTSIVNPRRLPARLAEDICMQCHQGGDARVLQAGKRYGDFRPGTPLIGTVAIFGLKEQGDADLLEHHASMKLSRCFRESKGKLGCMSCHDPHEQPQRAQARSYFRAKCMGCHDMQSCRLKGAGDDCVGCHMPKRGVERISHSALTNHRIPAKAGVAAVGPVAKPELEIVNGEAGAALPVVMRLAAYGQLLTRVPALEARYFEVLEEASRSAGDDPLVLASRGHKAMLEGSAEAAGLLARAEEKGARSVLVFADLGEALARAGRGEESIAALERGERLFPYSPVIRKHLVLGYIRQKSYDKARAAMERYVADFPEDEFMRGLLRQVDASKVKSVYP